MNYGEHCETELWATRVPAQVSLEWLTVCTDSAGHPNLKPAAVSNLFISVCLTDVQKGRKHCSKHHAPTSRYTQTTKAGQILVSMFLNITINLFLENILVMLIPMLF